MLSRRIGPSNVFVKIVISHILYTAYCRLCGWYAVLSFWGGGMMNDPVWTKGTTDVVDTHVSQDHHFKS